VQITKNAPYSANAFRGSIRAMFRLTHKTTSGPAAWVAIVAIALNAFWPLIAQLHPGDASMQMEGCAMQHSDLGDQDSMPTEPSPLTPHCAFCSLAPGGFVVMVADCVDPVPLTIDTKESRPISPVVRPHAFFSSSLAQPRAPPALS